MANSDLKYTITSSYDGKGVDAAATQLAALKKQLDDLSSKRLQLTADATQVQAEIANVKRDIAQLNTNVKLGMDDADAQARLAELKAKLQELQNKLLEIRADNADAMAKIAETKVAIDAIPNKKTTELDVNGDPAKAALKSAVDDMNSAQKSMSDSWNRTKAAGTAATFSIATAVTALTAAMVPVGVAAIGLGGAMVSGFGSAGLAAAGFGLSLKSTLTSAMNIVTSTNSLNQTLAAQRAELATLTPGSAAYNSVLKSIGATQAEINTVQKQGTAVQNQTAQSILGLEAEWKKLQGTMEQATGPLIQEGISIIAVAMKALPPLVASVSSALKPLLDQLKQFADGGGFTRFVQWIEQVGVPNLKSAVQVIANLVKMVAEIAVAFGDQGTTMMNLLVKVTGEIDKWGANGGFARFAAQVQSMLPQVDQFLKALFEALQNVTKALIQMGPTSLSMLSIVLRLAAAMPIGVVQAFFAAFAAYKVVALAVAAVSAMSTVTKGLGLAFKGTQIIMESFTAAQKGITVATDEGAASQTLMKIGTLASAAATKINAAATAVSKTAQEAWNTVTKEGIVAATAAKVEAMAQAVADGIATAATWAWNAAQSVWDALMSPIIVTIGLVVVAIAAIGFAIYELVDHWKTVWNAIKAFGLAIWDGIKTAFVAIWDGIKIAAIAVWDFIKKYWMDFLEALTPVGWGLFIYQHWSEIWNKIKGVVQPILDFLKGIWQAFLNAMSAAWSAVSSALSSAWNTVWNGIKTAAQAVWNALQAAWSAFMNAVKSIWDSISSALSSAWNTVWSTAKSVALAVWNALQAAWNAFMTAVKSIWDSISSALSSAWNTVWNTIKTVATAIWTALQTAWDAFLTAVKSIWDTISSALSSAWSTVWNTAKTVATTIWNALQAAWNTFLTGIKTLWDTISNAVQSAWSTFWNTLKSVYDSVSGAIMSALNTFWSGIKSGFQDVVNTVQSIWNTIEGIFTTPINFIIGVWDTVAGALGLPQISKIGASSPSSSAGGTKAPSASQANQYIPGSQAGATLTPGSTARASADGGHILGPGGPRDDVIPAWLSNGEFVMNASSVSHYGPGFMHAVNEKKLAAGGPAGHDGAPKFGLGGFISGIVSDVTSVGSTLLSGLESIPGVGSLVKGLVNVASTVVYDTAKPILDGIVNAVPDPAGGFPKPAGSVPKAGAQKIEDGVLSKLKAAQDAAKAAAAAQMGGAGTIPTAEHKALIDQALAKAGVPQSEWPQWEAGLNTLITRESSWNPDAINLTDSNATAGHPSQGLMQTIPSTFAAYSLGGSITDPVSNMVAGIRYIIATYGGIGNVQQANASAPPKGYDVGGPLMPGLTLANNTTGVMEGVLSPTGMAAVGGLPGLSALNSGAPFSSGGGGFGGGISIEININGSTASAEDIIQEVEDELIPKLTVLLKQGAGTR